MTNPWHNIPYGNDAPELVTAIIEIPKGCKIKYELDKESGLLKVDRVLFSSVHYPANYGFIPQTYCDDQDPLDVLVLGQEAVYPLSLMRAKTIGVMQMIDMDAEDAKIIAVHADDPEYADYTDVSQLPKHKMKELQRFFEDYKLLEHKAVRVERFLGREPALDIINQAIKLYARTYGRRVPAGKGTRIDKRTVRRVVREKTGKPARRKGRATQKG